MQLRSLKQTTFHPALVRLRDGNLMKLDGAVGQTLAVFDGLVWVTQAGDARDAFVSAGGTFTFDRPGIAIVEALSESRVAMLAAVADKEPEHESAVV